jgi:DNA (cytosine-5)-methyltransferase 1
VDNPFQSPVILSLCTGMRGLETGLERVLGPVTVAAYVEIEAFIIYNLVRQMEQGVVDPAPVWTDVKTFPAKQFYGKVHGITGGYPCQPFSVIGKQTGEDHPGHLWPGIKRIGKIIRPCWMWFENVVNHLQIGYQQVKADLEELGYTVKEGIYSAAECGAPHRRERLFILAVDYSQCEGLERYSGYVQRTGGGVENTG